MSKELVISANRHETKVALLEDDQLVEVYFQRANEYSLAGSIHKGRVTRVLPGMQSAFVDLGLERDTFLYVSDFFEEGEDFDRLPSRESRPPERAPRATVEAPPRESAAAETSEAVAEGTSAQPDSVQAGSRPERTEDSDRDRRGGRRSRRRRNRGRGFPESKYAPEVSRAPRSAEPAAAPSGEAGLQAESSESSDFSVLPGESLAKYRQSPIQPLDEAEEEEIRSLHEIADVPQPNTVEVSAAEAESIISEIDSREEPEASVAQELNGAPIPGVLASSVVEEEPDAPLSEAPLTIDSLLAEEPESIETSEELELVSEAIESAANEGTDEASASAEAESLQAHEGEASQPGVPPQTAQVREQGGRYSHRMPRRMRRKTRGGAYGEGRAEGERRGEAQTVSADQPSRPESSRVVSRPERSSTPSITELLKEGQEIIVQIAKEPLGQKGARITSHIALPGRFVVYMPTVEHTGVSRKIASDEERQRLKRILQVHHAGVPGGFIVRTAGEGKSEEELAADMNFLFNLWLDIRQKAEKSPAPVLLHHDLDIVQRTLRDQLTQEFKAIWVDNEEMYEGVVRFVQRFQPLLVNRIKLYTRSEPIFDAFNITAELEKALRPKVWLKSGGHIVINQTEALVAIDVNTGKYVGRSNRLEDTIVKTNTEAVKEIVRQVRLRDLGGIIVVDFIDMDERKNRQKVMQALEEAMRADRAPYKILQFNDFGLVAITRKRVKQSLERALCMPCPHCEGAGYVKSVQTIVGEILQEAHKLASVVEGKDVLLRVHPDVARFLKSNQNKYLEEFEEILHRPVLVKGDAQLHHEKFDLG